jgi:hypothetical protein
MELLLPFQNSPVTRSRRGIVAGEGGCAVSRNSRLRV